MSDTSDAAHVMMLAVESARESIAVCARTKHIATGYVIAHHLWTLPLCEEIDRLFLDRNLLHLDASPVQLLSLFETFFSECVTQMRLSLTASNVSPMYSNVSILSEQLYRHFDTFRADAEQLFLAVNNDEESSHNGLVSLLDVIATARQFNEMFHQEMRLPGLLRIAHFLQTGDAMYSVVYAFFWTWIHCYNDPLFHPERIIECIENLVGLSMDGASAN